MRVGRIGVAAAASSGTRPPPWPPRGGGRGDPRLVVGAGALVAGEAGECRAQIPGDGDRVDVAGPAFVAVDQVHHGRAAEAAERQAEVERGARDHDHVGLRLLQARVRLAASGWSARAAAGPAR